MQPQLQRIHMLLLSLNFQHAVVDLDHCFARYCNTLVKCLHLHLHLIRFKFAATRCCHSLSSQGTPSQLLLTDETTHVHAGCKLRREGSAVLSWERQLSPLLCSTVNERLWEPDLQR